MRRRRASPSCPRKWLTGFLGSSTAYLDRFLPDAGLLHATVRVNRTAPFKKASLLVDCFGVSVYRLLLHVEGTPDEIIVPATRIV